MLHDAQDQVAEMQVTLAEESIVVETKKKETDELLERVGQESIVAEEQAEIAAVEEEKVSKVQTDVGAFQESCLKDLAAAVLAVISAVMYMMAPKGTNLKKLDVTW